MAGVEDRYESEFDGGVVMPSTIHPKPAEALDNGEILRLDALTGQHVDTNAPLDPFHWVGNSRPDTQLDRQTKLRKQQQDRVRQQENARRYRESRS